LTSSGSFSFSNRTFLLQLALSALCQIKLYKPDTCYCLSPSSSGFVVTTLFTIYRSRRNHVLPLWIEENHVDIHVGP